MEETAVFLDKNRYFVIHCQGFLFEGCRKAPNNGAGEKICDAPRDFFLPRENLFSCA